MNISNISKYTFSVLFLLAFFTLLTDAQVIPVHTRASFPCNVNLTTITVKYNEPHVFLCENYEEHRGDVVYYLRSKSVFRVSVMSESEAIKLYKNDNCVDYETGNPYRCKCINRDVCKKKMDGNNVFYKQRIRERRLYILIHNYNDDTNIKAKVELNVMYIKFDSNSTIGIIN